MSNSATTTDPEDLSDEELLERIAELNEEKFPVVKHAKRGLRNIRNQEEESS